MNTWTPVSERLPTASDGDAGGFVEMLLRDGIEKEIVCRWDYADGPNVVAWRPKK